MTETKVIEAIKLYNSIQETNVQIKVLSRMLVAAKTEDVQYIEFAFKSSGVASIDEIDRDFVYTLMSSILNYKIGKKKEFESKLDRL